MSIRELIRGFARRLLRTRDVAASIRRRRLAVRKLIYRRPNSLVQTRELLAKLGYSRGRVVWVQSSWDEFYNLPAKPSDVVALMIEMLGPDGTLVMPVFPIDQNPNKILEIDYAPSSSGLLTEIFRRQPGVVRSIHLSSSVCALGPAADYLIRDHHRTVFPWGPLSPFARLMDCDARLACLGLGTFVRNLTPLHSVECLLYDELPYCRNLFHGTTKYRWRRKNGETGEHEYRLRTGRIRLRGYGRHFPRTSYVQHRLSGLDAYAIDATTAIRHGIYLARKGITIYSEPSPRPELFVPIGSNDEKML